MDQQNLTPAQTQANPAGTTPKVRKKVNSAAGKLGDWQRLLAPIVANDADLKHLEVLRDQLSAMATQVSDLSKQQAAQRAAKQEASRQLGEVLTEGQRLATLLRQAVKQRYGIRSEKLAEFGIQPFRGLKKTSEVPAAPQASSSDAAAPLK
jgi:hypothetical protein